MAPKYLPTVILRERLCKRLTATRREGRQHARQRARVPLRRGEQGPGMRLPGGSTDWADNQPMHETWQAAKEGRVVRLVTSARRARRIFERDACSGFARVQTAALGPCPCPRFAQRLSVARIEDPRASQVGRRDAVRAFPARRLGLGAAMRERHGKHYRCSDYQYR